MDSKTEQVFIERGFVEINEVDGNRSPNVYTAGCSGDRSACCTRTCSADQNYVDSSDAWEQFLDIEGGEIQY